MGKIDIIEYCGDCSNRGYEGNDLHCGKIGDKVAENMLCPDNCPLPDELEATRLERERCLKAVEAAWEDFMATDEPWGKHPFTMFKARIKARIEAGK